MLPLFIPFIDFELLMISLLFIVIYQYKELMIKNRSEKDLVTVKAIIVN